MGFELTQVRGCAGMTMPEPQWGIVTATKEATLRWSRKVLPPSVERAIQIPNSSTSSQAT